MNSLVPGTPKNLDEAIHQALCTVPLSKVQEMGYQVLRDYIAQKVQVAMLKRPEMTEEFKELFEDLVRRPFKEEPLTIEEWKRK